MAKECDNSRDDKEGGEKGDGESEQNPAAPTAAAVMPLFAMHPYPQSLPVAIPPGAGLAFPSPLTAGGSHVAATAFPQPQSPFHHYPYATMPQRAQLPASMLFSATTHSPPNVASMATNRGEASAEVPIKRLTIELRWKGTRGATLTNESAGGVCNNNDNSQPLPSYPKIRRVLRDPELTVEEFLYNLLSTSVQGNHLQLLWDSAVGNMTTGKNSTTKVQLSLGPHCSIEMTNGQLGIVLAKARKFSDVDRRDSVPSASLRLELATLDEVLLGPTDSLYHLLDSKEEVLVLQSSGGGRWGGDVSIDEQAMENGKDTTKRVDEQAMENGKDTTKRVEVSAAAAIPNGASKTSVHKEHDGSAVVSSTGHPPPPPPDKIAKPPKRNLRQRCTPASPLPSSDKASASPKRNSPPKLEPPLSSKTTQSRKRKPPPPIKKTLGPTPSPSENAVGSRKRKASSDTVETVPSESAQHRKKGRTEPAATSAAASAAATSVPRGQGGETPEKADDDLPGVIDTLAGTDGTIKDVERTERNEDPPDGEVSPISPSQSRLTTETTVAATSDNFPSSANQEEEKKEDESGLDAVSACSGDSSGMVADLLRYSKKANGDECGRTGGACGTERASRVTKDNNTAATGENGKQRAQASTTVSTPETSPRDDQQQSDPNEEPVEVDKLRSKPNENNDPKVARPDNAVVEGDTTNKSISGTASQDRAREDEKGDHAVEDDGGDSDSDASSSSNGSASSSNDSSSSSGKSSSSSNGSAWGKSSSSRNVPHSGKPTLSSSSMDLRKHSTRASKRVKSVLPLVVDASQETNKKRNKAKTVEKKGGAVKNLVSTKGPHKKKGAKRKPLLDPKKQLVFRPNGNGR